MAFTLSHADQHVAHLKAGSFSFILQNVYLRELAENCRVQLLVRDVDAWWQDVAPAKLVDQFAVTPPRPPAIQPWGMKVGFIFDPSGVLWHIAEVPF